MWKQVVRTTGTQKTIDSFLTYKHQHICLLKHFFSSGIWKRMICKSRWGNTRPVLRICFDIFHIFWETIQSQKLNGLWTYADLSSSSYRIKPFRIFNRNYHYTYRDKHQLLFQQAKDTLIIAKTFWFRLDISWVVCPIYTSSICLFSRDERGNRRVWLVYLCVVTRASVIY